MFRPILAGAEFRGRLIACLGAAISIALVAAACAHPALFTANLPAIVAPLGASAVLIFAVPASPLAQPWPVIGGNVISALVGITVFQAVPHPALAAGLAVGTAILVMSLLRCLHPPGGAAALTAVIGGAPVHEAGYAFAFLPVGINSVLLVLIGIAFHALAGRSYPHRPAAIPADPAGLHPSDIDAALEEMDESFDISPADLQALLTRAEAHAMRRRRPAPAAATRRFWNAGAR